MTTNEISDMPLIQAIYVFLYLNNEVIDIFYIRPPSEEQTSHYPLIESKLRYLRKNEIPKEAKMNYFGRCPHIENTSGKYNRLYLLPQ